MTESLAAVTMEGLEFVSKVFWGPDLDFCRAIHQDEGLFSPTALDCFTSMATISGTIAQIGAVIRSFEDGESLFNDLETRYVSLFISNRRRLPSSHPALNKK